MQGRNKFISIGSFRSYLVLDKDDKTAPLMSKYMSDVKDEITYQLQTDKKLSEEDAREMSDSMFSARIDKSKEIRNEIKDAFAKDMTKEDISKEIIKKYYKIANYNKHEEPDGHIEVTEISENKLYYHYETVSKSLFWNFIRILDELEVKFNFDLSMINDKENSLNHNIFYFYVDSDSIDKKAAIYEFSNSKIFSQTVEFIEREDDDEIKFYVGISEINKLRFGYIIGGNTYTIGGIDYQSDDMKKLSKYINGKNDDILFQTLGVKFKSTLYILQTIKKELLRYLGNYMDTKVYLTVVDNKLIVDVDTEDDDIVNYNYIYHILKENNFFKLKSDNFIITKEMNKYKIHYHISLK